MIHIHVSNQAWAALYNTPPVEGRVEAIAVADNMRYSVRVRGERLEAQKALRAATTVAEVAKVVWDASGLLDHREVGGGVQIFAHRFLGGSGRTLRTVGHAEYNAALAALAHEGEG